MSNQCHYTSLTGERRAYEVCNQPLVHDCPAPIRERMAAQPKADGPKQPKASEVPPSPE